MRQKINRVNLKLMLVWSLVIALLIYSRFVNLGWGLPFPMHPDERNMAVAIQELRCDFSNLRECLNPNFYAYGQFSLYLAYFVTWIIRMFKGLDGFKTIGITFNEAVFSLRFISALASIFSVFVLYEIVKNLINPKNYKVLIMLILIFSPFAIQFSHFGTTESFLILFYSLIIYFSLKILEIRKTDSKNLILSSIFSGLAVATKVSAIIFLIIPLLVLISKYKIKNSLRHYFLTFFLSGIFLFMASIVAIIFSPHNLIHFDSFVDSMKYESDVALGSYVVFYTRQFINSIPVWFQLTKIFPYALGIGISLIGLIGLISLNWKDKKVNLLRGAFLIYFIPNAFLFAKWTRFMAPVFPILTVFAILLFYKLKLKYFLKSLLVILMILPGILYLKVYIQKDVRLQATEWINKNIASNSTILSETANVVDIPLSTDLDKSFNLISFNFYDLDKNIELQNQLNENIKNADYIMIPSRRIFANLNVENPVLKKYYTNLSNGKLGFKKVAQFSSGLNDEQAEETWSVFDHPVIRIYKKVPNEK